MRFIVLFLLLTPFFGCKTEKVPQNEFFEAHDESFVYSGRTSNSAEGGKLITSAASVRTRVAGDSVTLFLKSDNENHQYVAVELNEEHLGRFRIIKDTLKFALRPDTLNTLAIYKETEASNGTLIFNGLRAQTIEKPVEEKRARIEFIGDSITCGMGADTAEIDCEEGEWFDQHSAYFAYGPRVARALDVDFELNCVSGIGIYRNWNDENEAVMPEVYPYLHLNGNHGERAEVSKEDPPQIVSIALGTNDFSLGDGVKNRTAFDPEKFRENYIRFIEAVFETYPETKVALLSSPMTGEEESKELIKILKEIQAELPERPIEIFEFDKINLRGCSGHPSLEDHKIMAKQLVPFYRKLLNKQ